MNKYIVRYYDRNPIDPQKRWDILHAFVDAASADEAKAIIENCDCEVIDVELHAPVYVDPITRDWDTPEEDEAWAYLSNAMCPDCSPDVGRHYDTRFTNCLRCGTRLIQPSTMDKTVDVSKYFNGIRATATHEWARRHLNDNVNEDPNRPLEDHEFNGWNDDPGYY